MAESLTLGAYASGETVQVLLWSKTCLCFYLAYEGVEISWTVLALQSVGWATVSLVRMLAAFGCGGEWPSVITRLPSKADALTHVRFRWSVVFNVA